MITLAVVPILVQAGTTAFSAFVAGGCTVLASLFRPLDWMRWCRRKPVTAFLLAGGILVATTSLIGLKHRLAIQARAQTDWTQIAINMIRAEQTASSRTGTSPRNLRAAWEFKIPGASFLSTPAVRDGRLYGASCIVDVGGTVGSIFCLDAKNGEVIWQIEKIDAQDLKAFFSSPALSSDGKFLVIGEGLHFDAECHLICLEAATGKLHWKVDVPRNHVESSPAFFGDQVVAGAGAIERANHLPVESPGYVFSVGIFNGNIRWQRNVVDPESSPQVDPDGNVYFGSGVNGCAVVALGTDGTQIWKTSTPYPATGPVFLVDERVVVGTGRGDFVNADSNPAGAVLALDRTSGRLLWQTNLADAVLGKLARDAAKLFCPVRDGSVVALNLQNGSPIWKRKISNAPVLAGVAHAGNYVFAVSSDGMLSVLDATTGQLVERHSLNSEADPGKANLCISTPVIHDGRVFVGSETGGLRCFVGTQQE